MHIPIPSRLDEVVERHKGRERSVRPAKPTSLPNVPPPLPFTGLEETDEPMMMFNLPPGTKITIEIPEEKD